MQYLKVITTSPGLSGGGVIFDYLLDRNDFISPFKQNPDKDQTKTSQRSDKHKDLSVSRAGVDRESLVTATAPE